MPSSCSVPCLSANLKVRREDNKDQVSLPGLNNFGVKDARVYLLLPAVETTKSEICETAAERNSSRTKSRLTQGRYLPLLIGEWRSQPTLRRELRVEAAVPFLYGLSIRSRLVRFESKRELIDSLKFLGNCTNPTSSLCCLLSPSSRNIRVVWKPR